MKRIFTQSFYFFFSLLLLSTHGFGQDNVFREFFTGEVRGWTYKNNSQPQTAEDGDWTVRGGPEGYVGPGVGDPDINAAAAFNISTTLLGGAGSVISKYAKLNYNYASVGYTEYDYDTAYISKWLISPLLIGIKNGDKIRFWTRERTIGATDIIASLLAKDPNGLTDCARPNKLEVRLSTTSFFDNNPRSYQLGNGPTDVGSFTTVLEVINPNLETEGYPKGWTQYEITISGLPSGRLFNGHLGFWYHYPNGGYNNCRSRLQLPPNVDLGLSLAGDIPGPIGEAAGYAQALFTIAKTVDAISTKNQKGKNGTFIGVDNVEFLPQDFINLREHGTDKIWRKGQGSTPTPMGYRGSPACPSPGKKSTITFSLNNTTDAEISVRIQKLGDFKDITKFTIFPLGLVEVPAGKSINITVSLNPELSPTDPRFPLKAHMQIIDVSGANETILFTPTFEAVVEEMDPPIARCRSYNTDLQLDSNGFASLLNPREFDAGSTPTCGDPAQLGFGFRRNPWETWGNSNLWFNCERTGVQTVYLTVSHPTSRHVALCPIQVTVLPPKNAVLINRDPVNYYLKKDEGAMTLDTNNLPRPRYTSPCKTDSYIERIVRYGDSLNLIYSPKLGVGQYLVEWKIVYQKQNASLLVPINVIDTISPRAICNDTVKIGFTYVPIIIGNRLPTRLKLRDDINAARDIDRNSYDNTGRFGERYWGQSGITKYTMYSPWYSGQLEYFPDSFEIQCSNIGSEFPVTLKVTDASGNSSTCQSYVKIVSPSQPECKNVAITLSPTTGIKNITTSDVLTNGVSGVCGMTNITLSRTNFNCSHINQTIPVTVGYRDPTDTVRGCVANVTVKEYSVVEDVCQDTVRRYLTNTTTFVEEFKPFVISPCNPARPYTLSVAGSNFPATTQSRLWSFNPGFTPVERMSVLLNDTFRCNVVYAVYDTLPPQISTPPANENLNVINQCYRTTDIPNPFVQGTYQTWRYTFTGATQKDVVISMNDYNYANSYWLSQRDTVNPGLTIVTLTATDRAGNRTIVSYNINVTAVSYPQPYVALPAEISRNITGNFCGTTYMLNTPSPMSVPCNQTGFMWYYEVRDGFMGNILAEQDSIPQLAGADIPIRIGAFINQDYPRVIHFGFHNKTSGTKQFSTIANVNIRDTISPVVVPNPVFIQNTNDSTFTYPYTIPSPIKYTNSCSGARWGYKVTGATNISSVANPSVTYTANQTIELGLNNYSQGYPSIPADSDALVILNNGENTVEYFILEESGASHFFSNAQYKFKVTVMDDSSPKITCAGNDTLYRSAGPCGVSVANPPAQFTGFTGPFTKSRLGVFGGNSRITLNKSKAPDSITFISNPAGFVVYKTSYTYIVFNTAGTVSFNWTYQSAAPGFFRPFALSNDAINVSRINQAPIAGFNQSNTGVQTGTFTKSVVAGEILKIGVLEGGGVAGYFRISNFSAPYATPSLAISQPTYPDNANYYFTSSMDTAFSIGNNRVGYTLTNLNNGRVAFCEKTVVVIDSFARNLNCQNKTIYLGPAGVFDLEAKDVIPASCFPITSTFLSKSRFTGNDIGTQSVSVTSIGSSNDTLTCNFNVTVIDTIKPTPRHAQLTLTLSSANTATLTDSIVRRFFLDNHKVVSVTKAKTNFTCDDVGGQNVLLTATDSSGNVGTVSAYVVVTPGFTSNVERTNTLSVCTKDSIHLFANENPGYSLNYQWQVKETNDTIKHWNYYSSAENIPFLSGADGHKFFRLNKETYLAYSTGTAIEFKKLDTIANNWRTALTPIAANLSTPYSFVIHIRPGHVEELEVAYINNSPRSFNMKLYGPSTNSWFTQNDFGFDFFTYQTASAPINSTDGRNFFFDQLYGDNGFYFPVNNLADVYAVNRDTSGFTRSYYRIRDTVQDWTGLWTIYRKDYDWYSSDPWVPSGAPAPTYVTNGKKVVGIRNTVNQNIFFEPTYRPSGVIVGKDSLTTDPTSGSSLFMIKSFNNIDYIAYRSSSGKVSVKQYNGANNWSFVGSPDLSIGQINKVSLGVVANALYLVYVETSGTMFVKKLQGGTWIDMGSPNDNISFASVGNELSIVDINGKPGIYFTLSTGGSQRLIIQSDWKNIPGQTSSSYKPNVAVGGQSEYRCVMGNSCGLFSASEISRVSVTQTPTIQILTQETSVVNFGSVQLMANSTGATTRWKYGFDDGAGVLGNGTTLTIPAVQNDTTVYAFTNNDNCYSDTVTAQIYALDSSLAIYNISVEDSVCANDYAKISLDTAIAGLQYSLLRKNSSGVFVPTGLRTTAYSPEQEIFFYVRPTQTEQYKIRVENAALDIVNFAPWEQHGDHVTFGNDSLPIGKELTIEAWVLGGPNPQDVLGVQYKNGNAFQPATTKNWEWAGNQFKVYRGNQTRSLTFPTFPVNEEWIHVATTAGPNGMKIYYDGVLVASNSSSIDTLNINNVSAHLRIGWKDSLVIPSELYAMDEFRVWNKERTATEIATMKDACLTGNEPGLVLSNSFSSYISNTKTFTSLKGPNAVFVMHPSNDYPVQYFERNGTCIQGSNPHLTGLITVNVIPNQPQIIYTDANYEAPDTICGATIVKLVAQASNGMVRWYSDYYADSLIGTGDTLTYFATSNVTLYPTAANSVCQRKEIEIELNDAVEVYETDVDTYCAGMEINDNNFRINYDGDAYRVYNDSVGGVPLDIFSWQGIGSGDGVDGDRVLTQSDTLWVEAYNYTGWGTNRVATCISPKRMPIYLNVFPFPTILSARDTFVYNGDSITLHATSDTTSVVRWFEIPTGNYLDEGPTFTTPNLTTTTRYKIAAYNNDWSCRSEFDTITVEVRNYLTRKDTILACESYTWIDGITYTASDTNITFRKSNVNTVDSLLKLNLTIIGFQQPTIQVSKSTMCVGDSSAITVQPTQAGYHYMLVDTSTNTVVRQPVLANGSAIHFNTGGLLQSKGYKIMATDTVHVGNKSLSCAKQMGQAFLIEAGRLRSSVEVSTCGSYLWRGNTYTQTGIFYDTLMAIQGCDSVLELHLTIFPVKERIDTVSTCDSYTWYGSTYYASTSTPTRFLGLTEYGCDSVARLHLTINNNTGVDNRVAWDAFTWTNGVTYTSSNNTAKDTLLNSKGCDSVVTLNLTILNSVARTWYQPRTICNGAVYTFNGNAYSTTGNYRDTLLSSSGLNDSIIVTQLTVNATHSINNPRAICSGSVYTINGKNYTATGTYRDTLQTTLGCDSIIITQLTVNAINSVNNPRTICSGGVYTFNGKNYTASGTYRDTLQSSLGCDSIIVTQLTVNPVYSVNNPRTICSGSVYTFNGKNYTTSGTYRDTLQTTLGCDSIIVTQLTVNPVYSVNNPRTICSGSVYTFNGKNYTTSGTYRDTLQTTLGCDSIIVTQLTVNPVYSLNNPRTICSGSVYTFNGKNYTTSGTYRDTLQTTLGCDSIIVTQLTVNPVYSVNNPRTICSGSVYTFNGKNYTASGTYRDTLQTTLGCDSIIVTQLTVNPVYSVNNPRTICSGSVYTFNGKNYTASGTYRDTLQTTLGCDSIIVTQLTVNPVYSINNPRTICSGSVYTFNGKNYTTSGTYRDTLQTTLGCDSIIVTQLTVNPVYSVNNPRTICSGSVYTFNGKNYTTSGTYRDTLQTTLGCDSIIVTQLTVNPVYSVNNPRTICSGSVYTFNGKNYTASGTYRDTLQTTLGCDSIIVTQLTVNPVYSINNPRTICSGSVYTFNGKNYTTSGTYRDTLQTTLGCDSIIVTQLTVNPVYSVNNPRTICSGSVYTLNGKNYTASGTYRDTLQTTLGCDSIIVTQLTVNPIYSVNNPRTICSGSVYTFNGKNYTTSGTYRDTLQTALGCDSIIVTQLTVNPVYSVNNPQTICSGSVYTFNSKNYTIAGTYRDTLQTTLGCDSIIVTQLTVNPKPTTSAISGVVNAAFNSIHTYSVSPTVGSTYNWIITNGTQISGTNTNSISVQWGSTMVNTAVKVVETNTTGCKGDTVSQTVSLPVTLLSFEAIRMGMDAQLTWITSSEINNKGFIVQRSFEGRIFDSIGFTKGHGTSAVQNNYTFVDEGIFNQPATTLFYRLKQLDLDGKFEYSPVVTISNPVIKHNNGTSILALPNPFNATFNLSIQSGAADLATIRVFDAQGKQVMETVKEINSGETIIPISQTDTWETGLFLVTVTINNQTHKVRVLKFE